MKYRRYCGKKKTVDVSLSKNEEPIYQPTYKGTRLRECEHIFDINVEEAMRRHRSTKSMKKKSVPQAKGDEVT